MPRLAPKKPKYIYLTKQQILDKDAAIITERGRRRLAEDQVSRLQYPDTTGQ